MKEIINFPNYLITKEGKVISKKSGNERKLDMNKRLGYFQIDLWKENKRSKFYIHRLVAQAFIPNPSNLREVNHIDSDRSNNHVSNLEWVTSSDNCFHAIRAGRRDHMSRMSEQDIKHILDLVLQGYSYLYISQTLPGAYKVPFLSTKVRKYARTYNLEALLDEELKRQRLVRARNNLGKTDNA